MPTQDTNTILYNWKIGGEAGYGIMNTGGPIFAKTLLKAGYNVFIYSEYPSLIRGGHNTMQVAVDQKEISAAYQGLDQLVALNGYTIIKHQAEVKTGGVVIYDADDIKFKVADSGIIDTVRIPTLSGVHTVNGAKKETRLRKDLKFLPIDLTKVAEEIGGNKIMKNVVAVGAGLRITNYELRITNLLEIAKEVVRDVFAKKGQKVIEANQRVLEAGYKLLIT